MPLRRFTILMFLLLSAVTPLFAQDAEELMARSPDEIKNGIENEHPVAYYVLVQKLFKEGEKDEAVFWFFAGQLRYRFHLVAHPDLDPSGDPATFASLSEVVGRPLNEYAFGDVDALVATMDRALEWDDETPNGFTSKTNFAKEWNETRDGMKGLRQKIADNKEMIRTRRIENGLQNRN